MNKAGHKELEPGVSAVVCCYNSAQVIEPTIRALAEQQAPQGINYEVILVDNNCTDKTVRLAELAWGDAGYPLRVIKEKEPGLIYARKTGVNNANYDILLFVDDDNILAGDWVKILHRLFKEMPNVGAIGGYNEALMPGNKPHWFDRFQGVYACGPRASASGLNPNKLFGAGLSFRTEVIKKILFAPLPLFLVGRTKNTLTRGEDTEIVLRCRLMGWDIYYDDNLLLKHNLLPQRITWDHVRRARKGGGAAGIILKIYRKLLKGDKPFSYTELVHHAFRQWKRYFKDNKKSFFHTRKEGYQSSFDFYRMLGMTGGLFSYMIKYPHIRKQIFAYYHCTDKMEK